MQVIDLLLTCDVWDDLTDRQCNHVFYSAMLRCCQVVPGAKKNTLYYESYKNFLINKIVSKKIQNLYVFEPKNINQERLDHLIFDYVSKDCFEIKDINSFIKKLVVRKCNEFKN